MGLSYRAYFEGVSGIYGCAKCKTHLATSDAIISTQFHGQHGQAYLFSKVINVTCGKEEVREMATGLHQVRDISCVYCSMLLGWTYVKAYNSENKYKEGKSVLEYKLLANLSAKSYIDHVEFI
ncbi:yippee zinc-binding/DNA-binding /Mis18, centromere assembly-domain-containing protein [Choanephora cucurbitarum]|nr:yippee zinc-binding/DNA-binding /Mis18, centromere assembly-domain-containing protein [Choanephora cucurbitarum]